MLFRSFVTQTMNPYGFPAKNRSGQLDVLEPPDLRALIAKCAAATNAPKGAITQQPINEQE